MVDVGAKSVGISSVLRIKNLEILCRMTHVLQIVAVVLFLLCRTQNLWRDICVKFYICIGIYSYNVVLELELL